MIPRLAADIRAKAILRTAAAAGAMAAVIRRGHETAGALYVKVDRLDGTADLYGPAPGPGVDDDGRPRWCVMEQAAPAGRIDDHVERRRRIDPDLWLLEIEDRTARAFLDGIVETDTPPPADPLVDRVFGTRR